MSAGKWVVLIVVMLGVSTQVGARSSKESAWIAEGQIQVKRKLKDSGSAKFRNVFFHQAPGAPPMSCGEVNSKNSFGGMTGYQRYVSAGSAKTTFLSEGVADFNAVWQRFCVD